MPTIASGKALGFHTYTGLFGLCYMSKLYLKHHNPPQVPLMNLVSDFHHPNHTTNIYQKYFCCIL